MANKPITPIPQNPIGESFAWRDWFQKLSDKVYGTLANQNANSVQINGGSLNGVTFTNGTVDGTPVGRDAPSTGNFSSVAIAAPLSIASGGTDGNAIPVAGAVAYGTGTGYGFTPVGVTGEVLTSRGGSAPAWEVASVVQAYAAASNVTVVHNFGAYPLVQVIDGTGLVFAPTSIKHNTLNDFTVVFAAPSTGSVIAGR